MNTQVAVEQKKDTAPESTRLTRDNVCYRPHVDILEDAQQLTVLADLPGVKAEDIDIRCEQGELTIRGRVTGRVPGKVRFLRREYGVGDFERSFRLSDVIDTSKIAAECHDGVLTLVLPKVEAARPRKIEVKAV